MARAPRMQILASTALLPSLMLVTKLLISALLAGSAMAQIALPAYARSYDAPSHARGFCFQVPTAIAVTGLQVPDELGIGKQTVALYRLSKKPPLYYNTVQATPVFYATGVDSGTIIEPAQPIAFAKNDWFAVLGTCGDATRQVSSYGDNLHATTVRGYSVTLERLLLQDNLVSSAGIGGLSSNVVNPLGRVRVYLASGARADAYGKGSGYLPLPTLLPDDTAPPVLGKLARMHVRAQWPRDPFGIVLFAAGRDEINTPVGTLLFRPPLLLIDVLPQVVTAQGLPVELQLPVIPELDGIAVNFQIFLWQDPDYALTNGLEWRFGL